MIGFNKRRLNKRYNYKRNNKFIKKTRKYNKINSPSDTRIKSLIVTDRAMVKLEFKDDANLMFIAAPGIGYYYRMNSIWDVDPLLGTAPTIGRTAWATLYSSYRVHSFKITARFQNQESVGVIIGMIPFAVGTGTNFYSTTVAAIQPLESNHWCKTKMLSPKGGGYDTCTMSMYVNIFKLQGDPQVKYDNAWGSSIGNNPNSIPYFQLFSYRVDSAAFVTGIFKDVKIDMYTELYGRVIQTN